MNFVSENLTLPQRCQKHNYDKNHREVCFEEKARVWLQPKAEKFFTAKPAPKWQGPVWQGCFATLEMSGFHESQPSSFLNWWFSVWQERNANSELQKQDLPSHCLPLAYCTVSPFRTETPGRQIIGLFQGPQQDIYSCGFLSSLWPVLWMRADAELRNQLLRAVSWQKTD